MQVIATAGHVDHGKSTLLRALTGMEPDRWEEERRRGLTIDLGFVWTGDTAFVDVPGHERFVTNMLAGVGPVPAVMLVVAADEGWRVQTQEHLDIVDALGIRHGLLVVTRCDLAGPDRALAEARERLAGTGLEGVPAPAVSALSGEGLPRLRAVLTELAGAMPEPDPAAGTRIWADRVFTAEGRGTVATATLGEGTVRVGDTLLADGEPVRVRGLHSLGTPREEVSGPARVAVNLRGAAASGIRRGTVLVTPDRWLPSAVVDVRLRPPGGTWRQAARHGGSAPPRPPAREAVWHQGAAAVPARVRRLGDDTARITLARELPLRIGDRALLRDPGSRRVWGATVLDVRPPELRRRGAAAARAQELRSMDGVPDGTAELRRRGLVRRAELVAMGADPPESALAAGEWLADPGRWDALRDRLVRVVTARAAEHPHDPGLPAEAVRQALELPDRSLVDALAAGTGLSRVRGRLSAAAPELPPRLARALETLTAELEREPFAAPTAERLAGLGLRPGDLAAAETAGRLVRIAPGVVLAPGCADRAVEILAALPQPFTAAQARQALNSTRRVTIPLLEHLDRLGRTRRTTDSLREVTRGAGRE
ncbi:SelB C-terminal domain-containing protein [Planobispora siamensis]|uniref:Selenocysteine-specific translation elongation factor n=1 Tax=Planobispora siamensis TaxID=936338 RepID=A0A8J3WQE3_9ACTN|nr:selenocysteine-specific translation elongation factor [Planobispora siamensis]GIH95701.1 selenocysteine-specific translation elongation factor [Planobispora siamensis]